MQIHTPFSCCLKPLWPTSCSDLVQHTPTSINDPAALAKMWRERRTLYEHLAQTAARFLVAEQNGEIIGFSRSIMRDGHLELTELFVSPEHQSGGVGRQLMTRAFPKEQGQTRSIISSADMRAQKLYMKMGVVPRFPVYYFGKSPQPATVSTDLAFEPITNLPETLAILSKLDQTILGHRRDTDHSWFLADRQGYLYYRDGQPVGYGYLGHRNGPFALLNSADYRGRAGSRGEYCRARRSPGIWSGSTHCKPNSRRIPVGARFQNGHLRRHIYERHAVWAV